MGNFSADFLNTSTGTLGIIGLPELAAVLRAAGVTVITGDDFKESAIAIRDAISGGGSSFPVLISDEKAPTKKAWANRIAGDTAVFLLETHTEDGITCDGARSISTPIEAGALLQAVGLGQYAPGVSGVLVDMDGTVSGAPLSAPLAGTASIDRELSEMMGGDGSFDPFGDDFDDMELPAYDTPVPAAQVFEEPTPAPVPVLPEPSVVQAEIVENPFANPFEDYAASPVESYIEADQEIVFEEHSETVQRFEPAALYEDMGQKITPAYDEDFNPWGDDEDEQAPVTSVSVQDFAAPAQQYERPSVADYSFDAPAAAPAPVRRQEPASPARRPEAPVHRPAPVEHRSSVADFTFDAPAAPAARPVQAPAPAVEDFDFPTAPASSSAANFDFDFAAPTVPAAPAPAVEKANPFASFDPAEDEDDEDEDLFLAVRVAAPSSRPAAPAAPSFRRTEPVAEQPVVEESPVVFDFPEEAAVEEDIFTNDNSYEDAAHLFTDDTFGYTPEARSVSNEPFIVTGDTPVLFVWGAKGGIGKTTMAIAAAQRAASMGVRTVLIDGNRGQGDTRKYLALDKPQLKLPSVHDIALGHDALSVIIPPLKMKEARGDATEPAKFALVQAPVSRVADPSIITGWVYNRAIDAARELADLVIIDTQTLELFDTTGLVDTMILPLLTKDAYSLAVTDMNIAGTSNLHDQLQSFAGRGMDRNRTMVLVNHADEPDAVTVDKLSRYFEDYASYLGAVDVDPEVEVSMNKGALPVLTDSAMDLIDAALLKVTGNAKFTKNAEAQPSAKPRFGRLRK